MNIFWLDQDVTKMAEYHCDKHVVKMPTECGQMLSDVMRRYGMEDAPYKPSNPNHPCTKWAGDGLLNYKKLREIAYALCKEYTSRYGKVHKIERMLEAGEFAETLPIPGPPTWTPPPNCTTIKDTHLNLIDVYRLYYIRDKKPTIDFKYYRGDKEEPWFMGDRFYQQQIAAIGDCPGNPKNKGKPEKVKKKTKQDYEELIGIPGLSNLLLKDLIALAAVWETNEVKLEMPSGRLKAPFVKECARLADIDWAKCTIATLKAVIEAKCGTT